MTNELNTIVDRINKKTSANEAARRKIENLDGQIKLYQNSKAKLEADVEQQAGEIEALANIQAEVISLYSRKESLGKKIISMVEKSEKVEWSPEKSPEQEQDEKKLKEAQEEHRAIDGEVDKLVKQANKIYYRR